MASTTTAASISSKGRVRPVGHLLMTLLVIREMVSFDTDAPTHRREVRGNLAGLLKELHLVVDCR
jgi:hypothetical protein